MDDRRPSGTAPEQQDDRDSGFPEPRRIAVWLGGVLAGLLILYLAAALALRTLVPPESLARWAEPRAEAALNRDVRIEGAELTLLPRLGVALRGVTVGNLEGFEGPALARLDRAELRVALLPLVVGDVVVNEAVLVGPDLHLQVDADGDSNFGDLVPASGEAGRGAGPGPLPISLTIRDVTLERGRAEYRDRRSGRAVIVDSLEGRGRLTRSDGHREVLLEGRARGLRVGLPELRDEPFRPGAAGARLRLRTGDGYRWLEVREGTLSVAGASFSADGRVDSVRSPVRRLSLVLTADSLELDGLARSSPAGTLPDPVESVEGVASLRVDVVGPIGGGAAPSVSGEMRLRDAGATVAGRGPVVQGLSGTLRARGDTLTAERLEGTVLGGPFRLTGRLALDSTRSWTGEVESTVSLARLAPAGPSGPPSGTVEAALDVSGRAGRAAATRARGTAVLRDVVLPADSARAEVRVPEGTLRFRGRSIAWSRLGVGLGTDGLTSTGRLERWPLLLADSDDRPSLRGTVESVRLDLDRLLPRPEDAPGYGRLLFGRLGRDSLADGHPGDAAAEVGYARPSSLPVAGVLELEVDTLLVRPYRFERLDARLEFGPDLIRVEGAEFDVFGGSVRQSVSLALGEGDRQPFSFSMEGRGMRAGDVLETSSPLGRLVTGTMGLELETTGLLDRRLLPDPDSLVGRGRMTVEGGSLSENPVTGALAGFLSYPALHSPSVERASVPFTLRGSSVTFDTARLNTDAGGLDWTGSVDLGGGLDVGARLRVPRSRLSEIDLEGTSLPGRLLDRLRGGGEGPLELGLRLGGTVASPRVGLDTDALRSRAREEADDRIRRGVERGRELLEERGRGLLRELGGDTAPAAPPESVAADTAGVAGPDSVGADTASART